MKFSEYKYTRPEIEKIIETIEDAKNRFLKAKDSKAAENILQNVLELNEHFSTMGTLCSIRNSINTEDEFYEKEINFFNENSPMFLKVMNEFLEVVLASKFRNDLEKVFTKQCFTKWELELKVFDKKIMNDLVEEAKLNTEYSKLLASAKIEFDGKINNLSQMNVYSNSLDRETRKAAERKRAEFMESIEDKLDSIYDKLVHIRTNMAKKLGYKTYTDFGYLRLGRSDYTAKEVSTYRKQVLEYVVPIAKKIIEAQSKRLGIDDIKSYDILCSIRMAILVMGNLRMSLF